MSLSEKLLEGKYIYSKDDSPYCEENFKVTHEDKPNGNFTFSSEVLSRVRTGEFLKVYVDYEVNHRYEPLNVRVVRHLGAKKSTEKYQINQKTKNVSYSFEGPESNGSFERIISGRPHYATPCFLTSFLMTQEKKIDPVQRTPYSIVTSPNIWGYNGEWQEAQFFVELVELEPITMKLHQHEVKASHCRVFQMNENSEIQPDGHELFVSKFFQVPYKGLFPGGVKIEAEKLKNFDSEYQHLFK